MTGQADRPPADGIIRFGELFDFVREKVKDATQQAGTGHQHGL